ncbi:MAG: glutamine-synthetase adenylyltransferase, partial [Pseudomonadota bacterium]
TAIDALIEAGLMPAEMMDAHDLLTDVLVAGRLLAPGGGEPPSAASRALARACQRDNYAELTHDIAVARKCVAAAWCDIFDQPLETE